MVRFQPIFVDFSPGSGVIYQFIPLNSVSVSPMLFPVCHIFAQQRPCPSYSRVKSTKFRLSPFIWRLDLTKGHKYGIVSVVKFINFTFKRQEVAL